MSWFWRTIQPPPPEDEIEYILGFACRQYHCHLTLSHDTPIYSIRETEHICRFCGEKAFPAVIRRIQGSHFYNGLFQSYWIRGSYEDETKKFVRFLDEDTVRLDEETVAKLRKYAARKPADGDEDADRAYQNGLNDGTILTAQYVLGELKDETNA